MPRGRRNHDALDPLARKRGRGVSYPGPKVQTREARLNDRNRKKPKQVPVAWSRHQVADTRPTTMLVDTANPGAGRGPRVTVYVPRIVGSTGSTLDITGDAPIVRLSTTTSITSSATVQVNNQYRTLGWDIEMWHTVDGDRGITRTPRAPRCWGEEEPYGNHYDDWLLVTHNNAAREREVRTLMQERARLEEPQVRVQQQLTPHRRRPGDVLNQEIERERERERERVRQIDEANRRAEELLMLGLNDEQKQSYRTQGFFIVTGSEGGRYKITKGTHGNVKKVDAQGRLLEFLCIQPNVPVGDANLAQKLWIECDENAFRRMANITPILPDGQRAAVIYGRPQHEVLQQRVA